MGYCESACGLRFPAVIFSSNTHIERSPSFGHKQLRNGIQREAPRLFICCHQQLDCSIARNDAASSGPQKKPAPELAAKDVVELQLDAVRSNDTPRQDHGLEVMYHFANAEGTLENGSLSCYFGHPSDLYHFGHFALKFKTRYPELIELKAYEILVIDEFVEQAEPACHIHVRVLDKTGSQSTWMFVLSKIRRGNNSPCWLTDALKKIS